LPGKSREYQGDKAMNDDSVGKCWNCGRPLVKVDYGRETLCIGCGKPTRVCRNCRFYTRGRPNDCAEPMAEEVMNKEKANFCDFFDPNPEPASGDASAAQTDLLKAAEDLFK
jgi:hypothetical protein